MQVKPVDTIWMNGRLVKWDEAKIHILSHVIHYGSSWFEGIRCYETKKGPAIFRLDAHLRRLYDSTKIYRAEIPYSKAELEAAIKATIRANNLRACYIRPIVYRGYGEVGVNPLNSPIDVSIGVWEWGAYLGPEALERGIDACVSSWRRPAPDTIPTIAKAGGNYLNSQLIKLEALASGYVEGIALDSFGNVRRQRREHLPRPGKNALHSSNRIGIVTGGDKVHRHHTGPRTGLSGGRNEHPPGDALHGGRGLLDRHSGGDHPRALRGPHYRRRGASGSDHQRGPNGVL